MRALLKSLSWRGVALTCTAMVVLWKTGSWEGALAIGVIDSLVKIVLYVGHEKLWDRLSPVGPDRGAFGGLSVSYDKEAQAGCILVLPGQPVAESVPLGNCVVDLDPCGQLVGVEVLSVLAEPGYFDRRECDGHDFGDADPDMFAL